MKELTKEKILNCTVDNTVEHIDLFQEKQRHIRTQIDLIKSGYSRNQFSTLNAQIIEE
jgi:hypothetical protein